MDRARRPSLIRRGALVALVAAASILGLAPSTIDAVDRVALAKMPLSIGADALFSEPRNDGRQGAPGEWALESGGLVGAGTLRLHVLLKPAAHGLPVDPGPAVLFAGLTVSGGGGDVGISADAGGFTKLVLPPCDGPTCLYDATLDIPTRGIDGAIRQLPAGAEPLGVEAHLTLVRTFGGGQWLQVLPVYAADGAALAGSAGTMGAAVRFQGPLFPVGLFPRSQATKVGKRPGADWTPLDYAKVVEAARRSVDDPTSKIATVQATLDVAIEPRCEESAHLTLHDDAGDHVFDADLFRVRRLAGTVALPTGVDWRLTLHDGGGIDFDQGRHGWGVRVGDIRTAGDPLEIRASFDCTIPSGVVDVIGGVATQPPTSTTAPAPSPLASATATSTASASTLASASPAPESTQAPVGGEAPPQGYARWGVLVVIGVFIGAALFTAWTALRRRRGPR